VKAASRREKASFSKKERRVKVSSGGNVSTSRVLSSVPARLLLRIGFFVALAFLQIFQDTSLSFIKLSDPGRVGVNALPVSSNLSDPPFSHSTSTFSSSSPSFFPILSCPISINRPLTTSSSPTNNPTTSSLNPTTRPRLNASPCFKVKVTSFSPLSSL